MTLKERKLLRNIDQPITLTAITTKLSIFNAIHSIVLKIRNILPHTLNYKYYDNVRFFPNDTNVLLNFPKTNKTEVTTLKALASFVLTCLPVHKTYSRLLDVLIKAHTHTRSLRHAMYSITHQIEEKVNNAPITHAHNFILTLELRTISVPPRRIDKILHFFNKALDKNMFSNSEFSQKVAYDITQLRHKYSGWVWVPVDKNTRMPARLCPVAHHQHLIKLFIKATLHFKILNTQPSDKTKTLDSTIAKMKNNLSKLPMLYNKTAAFLIPGIYITIKMDGVRARPIGSYAKTPYRLLLSRAATALLNILKFSGITQYTIYQSQHLKGYIRNINNIATTANAQIRKDTLDIKNFYLEVRKKALLPRIDFIFQAFKKKNHTDFISIPKYKNRNKNLLPHPGTDRSDAYINFNLDTLRAIICFALENAYFELGNHILEQINGIPMGDPLSGPLAFCYVAFDEHFFKLPPAISALALVFIKRYADDVLLIVISRFLSDALFNTIRNLLIDSLYEHDIEKKGLSLKPDMENSDKFLDSDIMIYNNSKNIRLIYHNKNASVMTGSMQTIGRFTHMHTPTAIKNKLSAPTNICIRIADYTTYDYDMIQPINELICELTTLAYNRNDIRSIICMAHRSRPHTVWPAIQHIL